VEEVLPAVGQRCVQGCVAGRVGGVEGVREVVEEEGEECRVWGRDGMMEGCAGGEWPEGVRVQEGEEEVVVASACLYEVGEGGCWEVGGDLQAELWREGGEGHCGGLFAGWVEVLAYIYI